MGKVVAYILWKMLWIVFPPNPSVEAITPHVTVFGEGLLGGDVE